MFLPAMVEYITDKQAEIRQAASYGIGVMAQFGGPQYADVCTGNFLFFSLTHTLFFLSLSIPLYPSCTHSLLFLFSHTVSLSLFPSLSLPLSLSLG